MLLLLGVEVRLARALVCAAVRETFEESGVLFAGVAAAGFSAVAWPTIGTIAASWVISPVLGGIAAAMLLSLINYTITDRIDKVSAARVWTGVAGALDDAHRNGVLHRDIKPGNIVVDPNGSPHLIDFGIARKTGDSTMTMAGFVLGTPDFLAPEVACGERATPASDAWQLAATISYALTGHPPRGHHADAVSGLRAAARDLSRSGRKPLQWSSPSTSTMGAAL